MFMYFRFNAYRGKKLALSICLCSLEAMTTCVLAFQDFYDKIVITTILTGKDGSDDD